MGATLAVRPVNRTEALLVTSRHPYGALSAVLDLQSRALYRSGNYQIPEYLWKQTIVPRARWEDAMVRQAKPVEWLLDIAHRLAYRQHHLGLPASILDGTDDAHDGVDALALAWQQAVLDPRQLLMSLGVHDRDLRYAVQERECLHGPPEKLPPFPARSTAPPTLHGGEERIVNPKRNSSPIVLVAAVLPRQQTQRSLFVDDCLRNLLDPMPAVLHGHSHSFLGSLLSRAREQPELGTGRVRPIVCQNSQGTLMGVLFEGVGGEEIRDVVRRLLREPVDKDHLRQAKQGALTAFHRRWQHAEALAAYIAQLHLAGQSDTIACDAPLLRSDDLGQVQDSTFIWGAWIGVGGIASKAARPGLPTRRQHGPHGGRPRQVLPVSRRVPLGLMNKLLSYLQQ
jgi:hypothetical protein